MENWLDILSELEGISPLLARIPREIRLYEVPPGYFNELTDRVLERIRAEVPDTAGLAGQADKQLPFSVPGNYFETFAEKMMNRIHAEEADSAARELEILSPLLSGMDKKIPFLVPAGYFEDFADSTADRIMDRSSPFLDNLKEKKSYEVPAGYFEELPEKIMRRIKEPRQQAKVIPIRKSGSWLKYAVAAAVAGAIVTGGILVFNPRGANPPGETVNSALAKVSDDEILNYLDLHNVPFTDSVNVTAALDPSENEAKDLLGDVSDEALQQYLDGQVSKNELMNN
ncbi:MAG TPA: hypothetical protein VGZ71_02605 [Puia sp.]|nr:hypothetical protein [Puia sp.]